MEPTLPEGPPPGPPGAAPPQHVRPGGAFGYFAILFLLVLPDLLAQGSSRVLGLAWSELFTLLLPALIAAEGSNLRSARYLGLDRAPPLPILLGALLGAAGFLAASGVMIAWVAVLPARLLDAIPDVARIFEGSRAAQAVVVLVAAALAPLCEEVAFRGYLQRTLARSMAPAAAIGLTALLFGVRHLDPIRFPALVLLGAVFGWASWRSGSIWPAVAAHAANNALATVTALSAGPGAGAAHPALADALAPLAAGGAALAIVAAGLRWATPAPPAPDEAIAPRDPTDPSTRFRLDRVPRALRAAAAAGLLTLSLLALLAPLWERMAGP